jgi:hypothetical protein
MILPGLLILATSSVLTTSQWGPPRETEVPSPAALSRDGTRLAVLPPRGGDPVRTFDFAPGVAPDTPILRTSSNDGLTFMGTRDGVTDLYTPPANGGPVRQLTPCNRSRRCEEF